MLLPGVVVQKGVVLGSGSLGAEDYVYPWRSVWVGLKEGNALQIAPSDSSYASKSSEEFLTPFAKAFYLHQASYSVYSQWFIALYNTLWQGYVHCYHHSAIAFTLLLYCALPIGWNNPSVTIVCVYIFCIFFMLVIHSLALVVDIGSKWYLIGRRLPGNYAWDESDYCQRWQLHLTIQEIRRVGRGNTGLLDLLQGSQYLVWYFQALGAKIGSNVCLYPNGGDPMMTEADLITIDDVCSIDNASVVAHVNTRGQFALNTLHLHTGCVLKSMSRLLSGSQPMQPHSILLEHTLVMAGESVESEIVWQGWPNRVQYSLWDYRLYMSELLAYHIQYDYKNNRYTFSSADSLDSSDLSHTVEESENDDSSSINV